MSARGLRLYLCTPFGEEVVEGVRHLRLEAHDGSLGVQPGHEPALLGLLPGALTLRAESESFVGTEGGFAWIEGESVRVITRWAARAESLQALLALLETRAERHSRLESEVQSQLRRHEGATQRALVGLQRQVTR